jgi:hypothetical protein
VFILFAQHYNVEQESNKVAMLEEKLRKQEEINQKLASRVKMLEFALKQQM